MVRNRVSIVRAYCDLLSFWSTCSDKRCRRLRRCRDRSGHCWNMRYSRTEPLRTRLGARIKLKRRTLPKALRDWQRRHDPGDALL